MSSRWLASSRIFHCAVVEEGRGEPFDAVAHDGADDGQRVDLIRLARAPFASGEAPMSLGATRNALAGGDKCLL